jgi:predicted transcriptional regulator
VESSRPGDIIDRLALVHQDWTQKGNTLKFKKAWYTIHEIVAETGIKKATIRWMLQSNMIPGAVKKGLVWRFPVKEVERLWEEEQTKNVRQQEKKRSRPRQHP